MRSSREETELHALKLAPPSRAGQRRVLRLCVADPLLVELEAVASDDDPSELRWKTTAIVAEKTLEKIL